MAKLIIRQVVSWKVQDAHGEFSFETKEDADHFVFASKFVDHIMDIAEQHGMNDVCIDDVLRILHAAIVTNAV